ncbi:HMG (high mobility group) box protein [Trifolium medium]|uniref:HMG (High mobility group) box protein n=1 Tax=Trifolium medium TaxID=97028 RepID=A0A392PHC6_9FABA|nr:HMG (high mobility group) box protein [Trifolium medium]
MPNTNDVQGDPCSSASIHLTDVERNKHTKSKSKEHRTKRVKVEKDPNMLEHPPTSFVLLFDQDSENNVNIMAVNAWKSLSNEDKMHYLRKAAKRKAKVDHFALITIFTAIEILVDHAHFLHCYIV